MIERILEKLPVALTVSILLFMVSVSTKDPVGIMSMGLISSNLATAWIVWETIKKTKENK